MLYIANVGDYMGLANNFSKKIAEF